MDDIINELREAGLDAWDMVTDPAKEIRGMRDGDEMSSEDVSEEIYSRQLAVAYAIGRLVEACSTYKGQAGDTKKVFSLALELILAAGATVTQEEEGKDE